MILPPRQSLPTPRVPSYQAHSSGHVDKQPLLPVDLTFLCFVVASPRGPSAQLLVVLLLLMTELTIVVVAAVAGKTQVVTVLVVLMV